MATQAVSTPYDPAQVARYHSVSRALHWLMAALILGNAAGGILHNAAPALIMPIHKSTGILILTLAAIRLGWRLLYPPPPHPPQVTRMEKSLAGVIHTILYALMFLVPLSGWMYASSGPAPLTFYGLFDIPKFAISRGDPLANIAGEGHELMAFLLLGLAVGHVGAAMYHHFIKNDPTLVRMTGRGLRR